MCSHKHRMDIKFLVLGGIPFNGLQNSRNLLYDGLLGILQVDKYVETERTDTLRREAEQHA